MSIRAIRSDTEHLPCVVIGADIYNLMLTGDKACSLTSEGWTSTGTCPKVLILDHHPNDSRTGIAEDQQAIQTLTSRMGTGGGNVPMILEYHSQALRIKPLEDDVSPTIPAGFGEGGANTTTPCLIVEPIPLEGNGARPSHRGDGYRKVGPMYSLNTTEVHSVAYAFEPGILKREGKENRVCEEVTPTIREHMGDNQTAVAYTVDMGGGKSSVCTYQEQSPTLACTHYGEPAVAYGVTTKGNGDAFIARERHTSLSNGGGQAGQGYPCVLYPQD